jgi:quinol-cytochrome oxidoreductase complex cytochrome b subunit
METRDEWVRLEARVAWALFFALSAVLVASGVLLVWYYAPIEALLQRGLFGLAVDVPVGMVSRQLHIWATRALVTLVGFHLLFVAVVRLTGGRRVGRWKTGTVAVAALALLAVTGFFFPWEQSSSWVAHVVARRADSAPEGPFSGPVNGRYDIRTYLPPPSMGQLWLFFAAHCLVLPLVAGIALFLQRRRRHALDRPPLD